MAARYDLGLNFVRQLFLLIWSDVVRTYVDNLMLMSASLAYTALCELNCESMSFRFSASVQGQRFGSHVQEGAWQRIDVFQPAYAVESYDLLKNGNSHN